MTWFSALNRQIHYRQTSFAYKTLWDKLHIEPVLLLGLLALTGSGLVVLYSATNGNVHLLMNQGIRIGMAFFAMLLFAQIPPYKYRAWAPILYSVCCLLLLAVLIIGTVGKGAQRWLNLGIIRFQPSELLKLALPMMIAWYFSIKPLPPNNTTLFKALLLILIPGFMVAKQPDLGTAIMVMSAGFAVVFLAGLSWRLISGASLLGIIGMPLLWLVMHDYQRSRVLTFLNPERDPLGSGYHIIQSKIAIGSGGIVGKGWLAGTQAHLDFLPEHATDFIFAVACEEFGLLGGLVIIGLLLFITLRVFILANRTQDCFGRLLAGALGVMFFLSAFINMGMVMGLLPVVGLPLPLVSYGGTAMVTTLASFGMIMAIHTHQRF